MNSHVLNAIQASPWAILPGTLQVIGDIAQRHADGIKLTAEEIEARIGQPEQPQASRSGAIAVLPLMGVIAKRMNLMTQVSGGVSTEAFAADFQALLADPDVSAIVLNVDSPGGSVSGIEELSTIIRNARGKKPVVAVANGIMASGAYWIATAADEVVVTPSGEVGSIGVFAIHSEESVADEKAGLKSTIISAGKYKTVTNQLEPLGDEGRSVIQKGVDDFYDLFVSAVAKNRSKPDARVRKNDVRNGFGEGRLVTAKESVLMNMADRVGTLDETIARLQRQSTARAAAARGTGTVREALAIQERLEGLRPVTEIIVPPEADTEEAPEAIKEIPAGGGVAQVTTIDPECEISLTVTGPTEGTNWLVVGDSVIVAINNTGGPVTISSPQELGKFIREHPVPGSPFDLERLRNMSGEELIGNEPPPRWFQMPPGAVVACSSMKGFAEHIAAVVDEAANEAEEARTEITAGNADVTITSPTGMSNLPAVGEAVTIAINDTGGPVTISSPEELAEFILEHPAPSSPFGLRGMSAEQLIGSGSTRAEYDKFFADVVAEAGGEPGDSVFEIASRAQIECLAIPWLAQRIAAIAEETVEEAEAKE